MDSYTVVVGDFNTPLSPIDRSTRPKKKVHKETLEINDTIDQMNLTDVYRIFHLWDTAKADLRGKLITMSAYIKNTETLHFKLLEKQEQAKPKISRRKEIIKIRAEINEIETKKNTKNQ
jgi:hypothetical protein